MTLIRQYIRAGYPAVCIETPEENRCVEIIKAELTNKTIYMISASGELLNITENSLDSEQVPLPKAIKQISALENTCLICLDIQHVIANPGIYRTIKQSMNICKGNGSSLVFIAPTWKLPAELQHDIPIIRLSLPDREELNSALRVIEDAGIVVNGERETLLDSATGLTLFEAENAFALAATKEGINAKAVEAEKMRQIKSSGLLEISAPVSAESIGGLSNLKQYIHEQIIPYRNNPLLRVKGVLLVGVPGTGKSLSAKALSSILKLPLLRLDIGKLQGSLVGQSESNMRQALDIAEAVAPCVLWLDEIEKGVGGFKSSANTDSGTTLRMVGHLLTWLQEHKADITCIATCNDHSKLPPELTRAGRFSEQFFLDCPTADERKDIALIHLNRISMPSIPESILSHIVKKTVNWTGAEIEELIISSARVSGMAITESIIDSVSADMRPICKIRSDEIESLRTWGKTNMRRANNPETIQETNMRTMELI